MMMIPGKWESRPRPAADGVAVESVPPAPITPADSRSAREPAPETRRQETAGWLKVSIFGATLLAAMWLVMWAVF